MRSDDGGIDDDRGATAQRTLTLTQIGLDVILSLSLEPAGTRLTNLATGIGAPVSSVQAALRILAANRIVERLDGPPPQYRLVESHPARTRLVALASVLIDPPKALAIVLRASSATGYAAVDHAGFIATVAADATIDDRARLAAALDDIAVARRDAPPVELAGEEEFGRLATASIGLRARLREAIVIKGRLPRLGAPRRQAASAPVPTDQMIS